MDKLRIFTGNSNRDLAERIAAKLEIPLGVAEVGRFSDGEISVKIGENVRGTDVFIIQSTHPPADNLLELLIMIDAARRASAKRITAVIPYFGYARQDRKDRPRVPITAKLVANLIVSAGANRVLTMDLHAAQIQGFFDIPVDHLFSSPTLARHFLKMEIPNLVVVSPDVGSIKMARAFAKWLGAGLALVDKRRPKPNSVEIVNVIGDVQEKNIIIRDDMIDTGGTLIQAVDALRREGALTIYAACTHPLFSGHAVERVSISELEKVIVTDTIVLPDHKRNDKIEVVSVADVFAEAIKRIHLEQSVSSLFY